MGVSPDVEKGFDVVGSKTSSTWRRSSPPVSNSGKQPTRTDHQPAPDEGSRDDSRRMHSDLRRRLTPLAVYGWLHRYSSYLFLLTVFLVFLRAGLHAANPPTSSPPVPPSSIAARAKSYIFSSEPTQHPIPGLMDAAEDRYRAKLARQSTTLAGAVAEYKRRYKRLPPAGFDKWYAFARKHNFVLIDEFDAVVEDLAPFWEISGAELRRRAELVGDLPSVDVVRVRAGNATAVSGGGSFHDSEAGARAKGFKAMLTRFVRDLPDMDFTVNAKAEGRVVVPWEHVAHPNLTDLDPPFLSPDWAGQGSVWDSWRRTCPPSSPARRLYSSIGAGWAGTAGARDRLAEGYYSAQALLSGGAPATDGPGTGGGSKLAFVQATGMDSIDFCDKPAAHYEHGHFFSDWRTLPLLVPVFSPARARGFADIRIPSHYYYGGTKRYTYAWDPVNLERRKTDPMEVPWKKKRDVVWWRGASTGGGSSPPGFGDSYHRHRFLRMSSVGHVPGTRTDATRTTALTFAVPRQPAALHPGSSSGSQLTTAGAEGSFGPGAPREYATARVSLAALNRDLMDVAFVKEVVPVGKEHRVGNSVELGVSWGFKYLLDLDGMGYSGRFMAFLASDSVPVKSTVYDEFFSAWIEPWVHYIPLSSSYAEIYNIVAYFSGTPPAAARAVGLAPAPYFGARAGPRDAGDFDDFDDDYDELWQDEDEDEEDDEEDDAPGMEGATEHRIGASDPRLAPPVGQEQGRAVERRGVAGATNSEEKQRPKVRRRLAGAQAPFQVPVQSAARGEGDQRLRRIARAGKQWKETIGRTVDMEVYVYRLAIEYARLWADDRAKMSYKG